MDKIHSDEWPVGYMIPTEEQLCEQFGVSRPTVRTAVLKLAQEGHVKRVKGKGTFVTAPRVLEQTTVFVESFFKEMKQRGLEIATEVLEFRVMTIDQELSARLETESDRAIKLSRLRYVKDSFDEGPIVLTTCYFSENRSFLFQYDFEKVSLSAVLNENECRRSTIEKEITAVTLNTRDSRMLGMKEGDLAIKIMSSSRDENDMVVDICDSLYPISRNQFMLKLQV
jgi:GntR family transcriptional regulator